MLLYVDKVSREINGETKELNALRRKMDSFCDYDQKFFNGIYYVVSPKIEMIGMGCFKNSKIRRIVLSPNLLIIDSDAFLNSDIKEIAIPKNTLIIGSSAFYICEELKNVYIPDSVISIGPFCFAQCSSLETIKLPKNLKKIESFTFATCSNLKEVILPENLETISEHAFENCVSLERLTITTKVEIEYAAYRSLKELTVEFKELKDIIQFIKKNRVNLIPKTHTGKKQNIKIIFKGKHLTKEDKEKIEELFKYNLYDYGYIEIDYEEETKEEQITNDEDKDLQ